MPVHPLTITEITNKAAELFIKALPVLWRDPSRCLITTSSSDVAHVRDDGHAGSFTVRRGFQRLWYAVAKGETIALPISEDVSAADIATAIVERMFPKPEILSWFVVGDYDIPVDGTPAPIARIEDSNPYLQCAGALTSAYMEQKQLRAIYHFQMGRMPFEAVQRLWVYGQSIVDFVPFDVVAFDHHYPMLPYNSGNGEDLLLPAFKTYSEYPKSNVWLNLRMVPATRHLPIKDRWVRQYVINALYLSIAKHVATSRKED